MEIVITVDVLMYFLECYRVFIEEEFEYSGIFECQPTVLYKIPRSVAQNRPVL